MNTMSRQEEGLERIRDLDVLSTIPEMLALQVEKRPNAVGWKSWDAKKKEWRDWTFREAYDEVERWRHALAGMGLERGARVAMLLPNCMEAVLFDQSVLANALTPVPLHAIDTPKSSAYILNDSGAEILVTNKKLKWRQIRESAELPNLKLVVITDDEFSDDPDAAIPTMSLETWLQKTPDAPLPPGPRSTDLAALVYTSGTTGSPKGVMLTHRNVLSNLRGVLLSLQPWSGETLLSFLPLSHTFERTASYYLAVGCGLTLAFNRSIANLADDLKTIRPSILMSVPRVYDMIYGKLRDGLAKQPKYVQYLFDWAVEVGWRRVCRENNLPLEPSGRAWLDPFVAGFLDRKVGKKLRAVFGDNIHLYISGGAALNPAVARVFLALGVPIYQGYGMTETSPIIAVNRIGSNHPTTVGPKLDNIEVRLSPEGELQVRGPSVMQGYWHREDAMKGGSQPATWRKSTKTDISASPAASRKSSSPLRAKKYRPQIWKRRLSATASSRRRWLSATIVPASDSLPSSIPMNGSASPKVSGSTPRMRSPSPRAKPLRRLCAASRPLPRASPITAFRALSRCSETRGRLKTVSSRRPSRLSAPRSCAATATKSTPCTKPLPRRRRPDRRKNA